MQVVILGDRWYSERLERRYNSHDKEFDGKVDLKKCYCNHLKILENIPNTANIPMYCILAAWYDRYSCQHCCDICSCGNITLALLDTGFCTNCNKITS
jgi:hypothetical protein